jgi:hypothetical protein
MIKRIVIFSILLVMIYQGAAFAMDLQGEVMFRDALYGAAIGGILGGAFYLADDDHFAAKFSTGVIVGTLGGLVVGVMESNSFVEIEKDKVKVAIPTPRIEKKGDGITYSASLLKTKF